jgi:hypothetical protein
VFVERGEEEDTEEDEDESTMCTGVEIQKYPTQQALLRH